MNKGNLRYIFYGAGAIGGVVGGLLALAGKEVILIGRPAQVEEIQQNGLRLITPGKTHTLNLKAVTDPGQINFSPDDVVFITVKSQDSDKALHDLSNVVKEIPIFCCQNGVRNEEMAARYFPGVYGVRVRIGALFVKNGEVTAKNDPPGGLIIGRFPSGKDSLTEKVASDLHDAGFWTLVTGEIMAYKWGQLIGNLANAPSAITGSTEEEGWTIIEAARREGAEILRQSGIRWVPEADIIQQVPEAATVRGAISGRHTNSTWQSLTRRQGNVESDYFNGEIVRLAGKLGKKAPVNEAILRIVEEMAVKREPPGKYTVPQLARMLGLI